MEDEKEDSSLVRHLMIVGDPQLAEFGSLLSWMDGDYFERSKRVQVPDIAGAVRKISTGVFPDLVIVLQSWSGEYSSAEVNALLAQIPLARLVVCYGPWCESDGRNWNIWPLPVRVPYWAAERRIAREWQSIVHPSESHPVPWSASREEIFDADHPPLGISAAPRSFLVDSPDPAYRQFLVELMSAGGHCPGDQRPDVIIFDADPWAFGRESVLTKLQARYPRAEIHAVVNFESPSLVTLLKIGGVASVSTKLGFCPLASGHQAAGC